MISAAEWLTPEEFRAINLAALEDPDGEYVRAGQSRSDLRHRIRRVRDGDLLRLLGALPPFQLQDWRPAWSHFMALVAGRHVFPDANHRTALTAFNEVLFRSTGNLVVLDPGEAARAVKASKSLRDAHYLAARRYFSINELRDPSHPYRILFHGFEPSLRLVNAEDAVRRIRKLARLKDAMQRQGSWPRRPPREPSEGDPDRP